MPVEMVHTILEDKAQSKWTQRLTPVTRTGKATLEGLEEVAKEVLKPYFHEGQEGVKVQFLSVAGDAQFFSLIGTHSWC